MRSARNTASRSTTACCCACTSWPRLNCGRSRRVHERPQPALQASAASTLDSEDYMQGNKDQGAAPGTLSQHAHLLVGAAIAPYTAQRKMRTDQSAPRDEDIFLHALCVCGVRCHRPGRDSLEVRQRAVRTDGMSEPGDRIHAQCR
eukprot:5820477-Prymnesium_polylepis.2